MKTISLSALTLYLLVACTAREPAEKAVETVQLSQFVRISGEQFILSGKPYYFVGTNMWYAANLAAEGQRERLIRELDELQALGIKNLRILGASEGRGDRRIRKVFQPVLGLFDRSMLEGLDFVLSEMGKRDMRAVIFLNNYWVWSGGMAQYVAWINNEPFPNPFLPEYDWSHFMRYSASFYRTPKAVEAQHKYIKMLLTRTNSVTGIPYINDPVIMSWQLANEPRPGLGEEAFQYKQAYLDWTENTARLIHELDPNHLVSTGNEGIIGSAVDEDMFLDAHRLPGIDYLTFHLWAKNWDWFDPMAAEDTYGPALDKARSYLKNHFEYAHNLGKPITLEEFGFPRDLQSYSAGSSIAWRDKYFTEILELVYQNAASGGAVAGSNFWAWAGEGRAADTSYIWDAGDEYMGDPPQEPQGLYSILDTDTSTIALLKRHADKMLGLMQ